jgi:hypothetical protein
MKSNLVSNIKNKIMGQFKPTACYSLSTHSIVCNQDGIEVILISTGTKVDGKLFADVFGVKVLNGDFCFGTISFTDSFKVTISVAKPNGGVHFDNDGPNPAITGSDELNNPGITKHIYNIDECPIEFSKSGDSLAIKCPCKTKPCTNKCYSKK